VLSKRAAMRHLSASGIRVAGSSPFLAADGAPYVRVTSGLVSPDDATEVAAALAAASVAE